MAQKILLIYNPKAGKGLFVSKLAEVVDMFVKSGYRVEVHPTQAPGDAVARAREIPGYIDMVVTAGGDGTLDEVVTGLVKSGRDVPIGYIPAGSTNDFANSIGLPKSIMECVDVVINGKPQAVDIGSFNGRYFSYVASFGAFTSTTYTVPQNIKNIMGHSAYVMAGVKELAHIKPIHARVTLEKGTPYEQVHEGDYVLGGVCNSRSIGGIVNLQKLDVDMNDGLMEVILIRMPKDLIELSDITSSILGGSFKSHQIEKYSVHKVTFELDENVHWTLDGEYEKGSGVCEIDTLESAISLIK